MNDRELLEMAAKAVGKKITKYPDQDGKYRVFSGEDTGWGPGDWNPLMDDGDALRLATSIGLRVQILLNDKPERTRVVFEDDDWICSYTEFHGERGASESTRLAIVKAAADIGISMP